MRAVFIYQEFYFIIEDIPVKKTLLQKNDKLKFAVVSMNFVRNELQLQVLY